MRCPQMKNINISKFSRGGCSSAGRAGRLVIERSLVQIPAQGKAELATYPGSTLPSLGLAPAATPRDPMERDKRLRIMT